MNATAKLELSILAAAFTLGILGDALLRCFPWGLNFALLGSLLAAAIFFLGRGRRQAFAGGGGWLLLPIALSPLAFLWHESPALKALNLLALLTALSLAMLRAQGGHLRVSSLVEYVLGSLIAGVHTAFGMFPLLFGNPEWKKSLGGGSRSGAAVLRGAAFSLLPLLIFGSLLMAADAVFQNLVHRVFHFDFTHLVVMAFITVCVGGYLRGLLFGKDLNLGTEKRLLPISLGAIETGVMMGLLDLLFLAFVAVQVRYFFGGSALVQATTGLTYAEYARRGFFELVTVAALVLPFLLFIHWLLRPEDAPGQRLFQWLAGMQVALLFVIMASAFQRMRLYQAEYGLSVPRLYPTAFMGWLAVVFVWFGLTVLRGHRERFAFGAMVAGFLLVAALHALDPDALIARTNMARSRAGHVFDAAYVARLSADAAPEIVAGLPTLNPADRRTLAKHLLERWSPPENPDWRSWTISRSRAWQAVSENAPALRAACAETKR
ncbi:MAG: DUF4173 domain-containing protein [Terriglobia bacterium]